MSTHISQPTPIVVTDNNGTYPGSLVVIPDGVSLFPVSLHDGSGNAITSTAGALNVSATFTGSISGNAAASATGSAVPSSADYQGVKVGSNLVGVTGFTIGSTTAQSVAIVDGSGNQITSFGSSGVVAQASTTSGQSGMLIQGAVTTSSPSYTTAQTSPLSLDLSGNLRVNVASVSASNGSGTIGSATPTTGVLVAGTDGTNLRGLSTNSSGQLNVINAGTFAVQAAATLNAETTKVIGVVRTSDGAGNLLTSNSTTPTAHFALDTNITSILGTAPTTVGKIDVKGADGDVFVRQATGSNLHTVIDSGTVTTVSTVSASRTVGNAGATLDSTIGAATAPTNAIATSAVYQTTVPALTAGQAVAKQADTTGATFVNIEGRKKTYSCYASFTGAAGDIAVLPGNATTTARVTRVEVSLSTSGTAGISEITLVKRSAADSGGTSASMTVVPHDSGFAAANSAPLSYTVAPTPGAAVGTIRGVRFFDESATLSGAATWLWEFGTRGGASAVVLRGTAQQLCINLGTAIATQTVTVSFEWEEDNS